MFSRFIHRPVLSIVISLIITILGIISLFKLPMTQFPNIAPPEVTVNVEFTGANAETVTKAAIVALERAINGVPGMKYMASDAANDGTGNVQVIFEVGTDPDVASVNVQNRIAAVMDELPKEVLKNGVKIAKEEKSMLLYLNLFSSDSTLDEKFLYNFADINLLAELKRIKGVGFVNIMGAKEYAMRIWLKPDKMLSYNISTDDVIQVLQEQNIEAAPGKVGESSDKMQNVQSLQYVLKYTGKYKTEDEYANIPIKSDENGRILKIKDIANVEFSSIFYDVEAKQNGRPSASIMLKQLPGSNASTVIANVKKRLEEIKGTSFLKGMDYEISYDVSRFLDASIEEVIRTFIEAFILVALVVFLFLQDLRSTLIPAIAVPVSLIGTFFFMQMFGFSLNLITLFALVLAIGIVVDNAIVVVEAVHLKMEKSNITPLRATEKAMKEISGAIIAITLVMSAVFIPVAFISGPTGIFYRQFSLTMAIAIVLSGIIALTLTPALCALILKNPHGHKKTKQNFLTRFFDRFNVWYRQLSLRYQKLLSVIANRRLVTFGILIAFCAGTGLLGKMLPNGFIPNEDQGSFYASITTPSGSTLERTKEMVNAVQKACEGIDAIESVSTLSGTNILSNGTGATYGSCIINLKNWKDRKESVDDVIEIVSKKTKNLKDAEIEFFPPPAVPGYGNASGIEMRLLDKTGTGDLKKLGNVTNDFIKELKTCPELSDAFTIFDATFPQYLLKMDIDKAAQKGVTVSNVMSTLQTMLGSEYATNFMRFGQLYKVMVQALPEYRAKPDDVLRMTVKNKDGEMIPVSAFLSIERVSGVEMLTRYNMYPSAEVNGQVANGCSSGKAIESIKKLAKDKLPRGYDIEWAGITRDEVMAGNESIYVFIICLLFVYLLLAAQYESFLLPLPVILSLPTGIFGAYFLLMAMGLENNIYAQIALIMLIGLLGKNAILIVEFATLRHRAGRTPLQAAIEGAKMRLRPILMTSFAFIAGMLPLLFASGAGAVGNRTLGAAAAGGMLFGTIFGVIIIPGLYVIFAKMAEKTKRDKRREELALTEDL